MKKCTVVVQYRRDGIVEDEEVVYSTESDEEAVDYKYLVVNAKTYYSEMTRIADLLFPYGDSEHEWTVDLLDEIAEIVRECNIPARYFKSKWTGE